MRIVNILLKKECLVAVAAGMVWVFVLMAMLQQGGGDESPQMFEQQAYHKEIGTGTRIVQLDEREGEVPQNLIDELNQKGNDHETLHKKH